MGQPVVSQALEVMTASIDNGASLSGAVDLGGRKLAAIDMPAAWTAANITFQASADGITYDDLYDNSTERSLTVAASRYLMQNIGDWVGLRYLKIRSGTSGTPVNQGASRIITLLVQP